MNQGIQTIRYPVTHLATAKSVFRALSGVDPYIDEAYYVGFPIGDQEIGLDPNGHAQGMTGLVGYSHVDDITSVLKSLLDAGAQAQQDVTDVGGGKLIACVRDGDGSVIGLLQLP
jgi:predicted enzyme related to lactoylglutathione lyase